MIPSKNAQGIKPSFKSQVKISIVLVVLIIQQNHFDYGKPLFNQSIESVHRLALNLVKGVRTSTRHSALIFTWAILHITNEARLTCCSSTWAWKIQLGQTVPGIHVGIKLGPSKLLNGQPKLDVLTLIRKLIRDHNSFGSQISNISMGPVRSNGSRSIKKHAARDETY
ncbi:hypothetical protein VNO77_26990 [Canavalia gladiata]|uniref:Uncharacterized protein n=1 Tax=Canavalia gladiata TaxID=3824 RepID=A0AAN9KY18_CANGL